MYVVEVIPLSRGSKIGTLTYYSSVLYSIGTIIDIPVRNRSVRGLVLSHRPVSAAKTAVRAATFSLKKLPEQENTNTLPPNLIECAKQLSQIYPATIGTILYSLLPEEVREGKQILESNLPHIGEYETPQISLLQATEEERFRTYRSRIREAFAHRGSVLFVVPTSSAVDNANETLSQGIENRIVNLSSSLSAKKLEKSYLSFHDLSHAKLIITTPSHAFIDRHDITHVIIDQSRSPYYKSRHRPYLDTREVLKTQAKISGRQVILGDVLPSTEDEYRRREDLYQTEGEHPKRIAFDNKLHVIKQNDKPKPDSPFELFSPNLLETIKETVAARKKVFLYSARRGIAPVVVCIDCGHIFRCPDSGSPYTLLRITKNQEEERWFISSVSGRRERAADVCPDCGSWRLKERGVGIQYLYDELSSYIDKSIITLFDHTTATSRRRAQTLVADFYERKGSILLGTAMALPYLEKPVSLSAIVSLDATRAIPTWRAEEELLALLIKLREKTADSVLIQTRSEVDEVIEYAKTGQVDRFYDDEIELRQNLNYPPFSKLILLTISGESVAVSDLEKTILPMIEKWGPKAYNAPQSTAKKTVRYCLLKIPNEKWPDEKLIQTLMSLPPMVKIEIDPDKIV